MDDVMCTTCECCGEEYELDGERTEPTRWCDGCAQDLLPDLLAACEAAYEEYSQNRYGSGGCTVLAALASVIAKAKGGA